jgi:pyridoxal phosphate-dependent aminotransferase EpsN
MKKDKIFLSPPHMSGREMHYIKEAFDSNWIAPLGPNVDAFEKEVANYVGTNDGIAVSSGTAAIHLALSLLGVAKGDTVFCSTLTFVASANPILYLGAEPVFIDSELDTWNMSPLALKRALHDAQQEGNLPKAVIVVNLYGQSAKMDALLLICNFYGVPLIEDAAESLGATYKGKASGTFGKYGIYSFNGNKIITTSGGGMLVSDNIASIQTARFLSTQAKDPAPYYQHSVMGYNYRMSNLLAGVGRSQLQQLDHRVEAKRYIFRRYLHSLADLPGIEFMPELENTRSTRWLTTLTIDEEVAGVSALQLVEALEKENIEARLVWKPLHMQPMFKGARYYSHSEYEHHAESLFASGVCLPSGTSLTTAEQDRVIECIKKLFNKSSTRRFFIIDKYGVLDQ